jgi:hypothetical protein
MGKRLQKLNAYLAGRSRITDFISLKILSESSSDEEKQSLVEKEIEGIMEKSLEFSSNTDFYIELLDLIDQVKFAASEKRWTHAQHILAEATSLVNRAIGSEGLRFIRFGLVLAPFLWFVFFYYLQRFMEQIGQPEGLFGLISQEYFQYIWLGMAGGTTMVLWGVVKHSAELDFNSAYIFSYLLKPGVGAIIGLIVVLVAQVFYMALQGDLKTSHTEPFLVLAFVGGFSERFIIGLLDRAMTAILGGGKNSKTQTMITRSLPSVPKEMPGEPEEKD